MTTQEKIAQKQKELFDLCKFDNLQCFILTERREPDSGMFALVNFKNDNRKEVSKEETLLLLNRTSMVIQEITNKQFCIKSVK